MAFDGFELWEKSIFYEKLNSEVLMYRTPDIIGPTEELKSEDPEEYWRLFWEMQREFDAIEEKYGRQERDLGYYRRTLYRVMFSQDYLNNTQRAKHCPGCVALISTLDIEAGELVYFIVDHKVTEHRYSEFNKEDEFSLYKLLWEYSLRTIDLEELGYWLHDEWGRKELEDGRFIGWGDN